MPARSYTLEIITQERVVYSGAVTSVIAPGEKGYFSVWANHAPLLAALRPGVMTIREATGKELHLAVGGGFFEVRANHAIVLADSADFPEDIDGARERERLRQARHKMLHPLSTSTDPELARQEAELAAARLKAIGES